MSVFSPVGDLFEWVFSGFQSAWDKALIYFRGKNLAILGARGVGKTHLIHFLSRGEIPTEYKQTVAPEKYSGRRFKLENLDLKIKSNLDVPGGQAAYAEWKNLCSEADIIFYLFRADMLLVRDEKCEERVRSDLRHLNTWRKNEKEPRQIFLVGTHCDKDPNYSAYSLRFGDYVDKFHELPIVAELIGHAGGGRGVKVVLGSMKSLDDTQALVLQIFKQAVT